MKTRLCHSCNTPRPWPSAFYRNSARAAGRQTVCKACVKARGYWKKRTPEYRAWVNMRQRCRNPANGNYHNYGALGISICEAWEEFAAFADDMGPKPEVGGRVVLGRLDVDGDYEPGNCRWAAAVARGVGAGVGPEPEAPPSHMTTADIDSIRAHLAKDDVALPELAAVFGRTVEEILEMAEGEIV